MKMYTMRWFLVLAMIITLKPSASAQRPQIVRTVRAAIAAGDFAKAQSALDAHQSKDSGYLEALSWMARGHLGAERLVEADSHATKTRSESLALLKTRGLDDDTSLPLALGASIEVLALVMNERAQRSEAVAFLAGELKRWHDTSIRTRIQKNLHLISLVGKPAPALITKEYLGVAPPSLASLKGRKTLLFFWAHWCGDCKAQAPILAKIRKEIPESKLAIIAPTQPYGYVEGGNEAPLADEIAYIKGVFEKYYSRIDGVTVPVSEENFKAWGSSTTPTMVLIDAGGVVRLYHPGRMTYEELVLALRD
jgi:thiol-disulfide isomerase/thioredoxin